jgi:hypothetical protein
VHTSPKYFVLQSYTWPVSVNTYTHHSGLHKYDSDTPTHIIAVYISTTCFSISELSLATGNSMKFVSNEKKHIILSQDVGDFPFNIKTTYEDSNKL